KDRVRKPVGGAAFQWLVPILGVETSLPLPNRPPIIASCLNQVHFFPHRLPNIGDEQASFSRVRIVEGLVLPQRHRDVVSYVEGKTIGIAKSIGKDFWETFP